MDFKSMLIRIPVIVLVLSVHEFAHGFMAYMLGDTTAKYDGRLSLNPFRHIDPLGILALLIFRFGWAKPVMVNPRNFKNPKVDMALTAFAGPFSNMIFAFVTLLIFYPFSLTNPSSSPLTDLLALFLWELLFVNLSLGLFNMLPIPPLDGSKIFGALLPDQIYFRVTNTRIGMIVLLVLIWTNMVSKILDPLVGTMFSGMLFLARKIYFFI